MSLDLAARRALLRAAAQGPHGFTEAIGGADEAERAALAKTLPPSRVFSAEGPTPRACYLLAALAKPQFAAETIVSSDHSRSPAFQAASVPLAATIVAAASERPAAWQTSFVDAVADRHWYARELAWRVCFALVHEHQARGESLPYLGCFVTAVSGDADGVTAAEHGARIADRLRSDPGLLADFWALFRVEGAGLHYLLTEGCGDAWDAAITDLDTDPALRDALLDASLGALLRDFPARTLAWYLRIQRLLAPTPQEVAARAPQYLGVLVSPPSTAVGWAQEALLGGVRAGLVDANALVAASPAVLARTEKKLLRAHLGLLAALDLGETQSQTVSDLVSDALPGLPSELGAAARRLLAPGPSPLANLDAAAEVTPQEPGQGEASVGEAVTVPGPRRTALPRPTPEADEASRGLNDAGSPTALSSQEAFALMAEHLEGTGDGADLARLSAYPDLAVFAPLRGRAAQVLHDTWDAGQLSPRRYLAALILDTDAPTPRGFQRYVVLSPGEEPPADVEVEDFTMTSTGYDAETGQWQEAERWHGRSGYASVHTLAPAALLAQALFAARMARRIGAPVTPPIPLPATGPLPWRREVRAPGQGTFGRELEVLGTRPRAFWLAETDELTHPALVLEPVAAEFTFRAQQAREQDGYDQIVAWAAWLLREHTDVLAAHQHPALYAATVVVNVRGSAPLFAALGTSTQVPTAPVYSALALGLGAKEATHRAQAAEACAALAQANLLDPEPFAHELGAHLSEGTVLAGRIADALADAASIGALSGYRVLQTLAVLLPDLTGVRNPGALVTLTARLARDYGTPVALPEALAAKGRGSSVLAHAVRDLAAVRAHPTDLAREAAATATPQKGDPDDL